MVNQKNKQTFFPPPVGEVSNLAGAERPINSKVYHSRKYRELLNNIQTIHGDSCKVSIIPAVPVSVAVEYGQVLLPKSDTEVFACEYAGQNELRTVLKIN